MVAVKSEAEKKKCCELNTPGGSKVSGPCAPCCWCCCVCCCEPLLQTTAKDFIEKEVEKAGEQVIKRALTQSLKDVVLQIDAPGNEKMEGRERATSTRSVRIVGKEEAAAGSAAVEKPAPEGDLARTKSKFSAQTGLEAAWSKPPSAPPAVTPATFYSTLREYEETGLVKLSGLAPDDIDAWVNAFSAHYELSLVRPGFIKDRQQTSQTAMAPSYENDADDVVRPHCEMDEAIKMCFFMVVNPGDVGGQGIMLDLQRLDTSKWEPFLVDGKVFVGHVATRLDEAMYKHFLAYCAKQGLLLNDKHSKCISDIVTRQRALMSEAEFKMKFGTGEPTNNFSDEQLEELFSYASVHNYQAGELYLIDNRKWMHARTQFAGPRKLRVAFLMDSSIAFGKVMQANGNLVPPYPTRVPPPK